MKRFVKFVAPIAVLLVVLIPLVSAQGSPIGEVDTSAGETTYNQVCMACHMMNGEGVPSAFPPLAGHFPDLVAVEGGRDYVIQTVLYGLMGAITIDGVAYNSVMSPHAAMFDDEQIANVLNYVAASWGNADLLPEGFLAFTADEVAPARDTPLTADEVYAIRSELGY